MMRTSQNAAHSFPSLDAITTRWLGATAAAAGKHAKPGHNLSAETLPDRLNVNI